MIAPDVETGIARLRELIDAAQAIVPFTGAGISTECGIPDFRSPGGIWTKNRPIQFDEFQSSQEMRNEAWRRRFAMEEHASGQAPDCSDCGGHIKSATVSFGQAMPETAMQRAQEMTMACDLFLAIGSSLVVWPAAGFPLMAKRNGARLVILNREATELDEIADLVVRDDIGTVLSPFIAH